MTDKKVVPAWYEAPMTRSSAKNPDVATAVKEHLNAALATVQDSKPLSKSDLARLATELLNAQGQKSPSVS